MDTRNFAVFFLKVVCDATSKLILFGTWMLTYKSWNFDSNLIVAYYYGMMSILMMVNFGFSIKEKEQIVSLRNMIGTIIDNLMLMS